MNDPQMFIEPVMEAGEVARSPSTVRDRLRRGIAAVTRRLRGTAGAKPAVRRNLSMFLRTWHQRAGLFAFLFMGWLGFSGFLINQSAGWGYDTVRIRWPWVMSLYSLKPEPPQSGFSASGHWLAVTPDGTVLDAKPVMPPVHAPIGLVDAQVDGETLLFIASADAVAIAKTDGSRFDELKPPILPVPQVRRIGKVHGQSGAVAVQDLDSFSSSDGGISWKPVAPADVEWSQTVVLPEAERTRLLPFSRPSVSLEHVLVDAHSGRLFGNVGAWVINSVGFASIWLALSGIWMYWRASRRRQAAGR
jgi:hypothetical protein